MAIRSSFNTQPPEGGCFDGISARARGHCFNTQPPEGGCRGNITKAAGSARFNTQPPEGGCLERLRDRGAQLRFNTQPPEGGCGGKTPCTPPSSVFQHTAARRRLPARAPASLCAALVSTHSRPKAAAAAAPTPNYTAWFQHTAARRRLPARPNLHARAMPRFNTQPPEGGCQPVGLTHASRTSFNTQPPEGGCLRNLNLYPLRKVSTHSRPKAAATRRIWYRWISIWFQHTAARRRLRACICSLCLDCQFQHTAARRRLLPFKHQCAAGACFNTQPPEGGCLRGPLLLIRLKVSTHSRPKAAATCTCLSDYFEKFQHTAARRRLRARLFQPGNQSGFQHTAARRRLRGPALIQDGGNSVSTHSRPKAAAHAALRSGPPLPFQHTAARRRLRRLGPLAWLVRAFQHTAARRRLRAGFVILCAKCVVSTHSRPKAAASASPRMSVTGMRFNTQPPEGGCPRAAPRRHALRSFNTQPPEGGCSLLENSLKIRQLEVTFR